MNLFNVGRLCIKLAGRDAGRKCIVVEQLDTNYVLVDGNVRRKKVNITHLEPLEKTVEINNNISHEEVKEVFEKLGEAVWDKKSKNPAERVKKQKKKKEKKLKVKEVEKLEEEVKFHEELVKGEQLQEQKEQEQE